MSTAATQESDDKLKTKKTFFDEDFRRDIGNGFKSSLVIGTKVAAVAAPLLLVVGAVNWMFGQRKE